MRHLRRIFLRSFFWRNVHSAFFEDPHVGEAANNHITSGVVILLKWMSTAHGGEAELRDIKKLISYIEWLNTMILSGRTLFVGGRDRVDRQSSDSRIIQTHNMIAQTKWWSMVFWRAVFECSLARVSVRILWIFWERRINKLLLWERPIISLGKTWHVLKRINTSYQGGLLSRDVHFLLLLN